MLYTIGFNNSKLEIIGGDNAMCAQGKKLRRNDMSYPMICLKPSILQLAFSENGYMSI